MSLDLPRPERGDWLRVVRARELPFDALELGESERFRVTVRRRESWSKLEIHVADDLPHSSPAHGVFEALQALEPGCVVAFSCNVNDRARSRFKHVLRINPWTFDAPQTRGHDAG